MATADAHAAGERDAAALEWIARTAMAAYGVEPDYLALVAPDSLAPVTRVDGEVLVAVAATIGGVRLIDNQLLGTPADGRRQPASATPTHSERSTP